MQERTRIAAIIIKDHKLLMVKGSDQYKELWTPGGKIEKGESDLDCLKRELREELNVKLIYAKFFREYAAKSPYHADLITISRIYLVEISGKIKTAKEIQRHIWMTKKQFEEKKYPLIPVDQEEIIPDLIKAEEF